MGRCACILIIVIILHIGKICKIQALFEKNNDSIDYEKIYFSDFIFLHTYVCTFETVFASSIVTAGCRGFECRMNIEHAVDKEGRTHANIC